MCKKNCKKSNTHIDKCLKPLIRFLRETGYDTVGSCCGHNKYPISVVVKFMHNGIPEHTELFTNTKIPRSRRFYKQDKEGFYYIPEVTK